MKRGRAGKIIAFLLAIVMCFTVDLPVYAAEVTQDNLVVTMTTDQESYDVDETITATITLKNNNYYAVTDISLEEYIPTGYTMNILSGTASIEKLAAGEKVECVVKFVPDPSLFVEQGIKIFETTFEESNPFTVTDREVNKVARVDSEEEDHGMVVEFERADGNTQNFYMQYVGVGSATSSHIVYEFDVNLKSGANEYFRMMLRAGESWYTPLRIENNVLKAAGTTDLQNLATLNDDTWYTVTVAYNYADNYMNVYLDGKKLAASETLCVNDFVKNEVTAANAQTLRFIAYNKSVGSEHFLLDNVRVYEGSQPYEGELKDPVRANPDSNPIEIDYDSTIFNREKLDTSEFPGMLKGYVSLHTGNGMVYQGSAEGQEGTWTKLDTMPVETEDGFLVVAEEICSVLGYTYTENGGTVTINNTPAEVTSKDGKLWIDAKYFFETILGKTVAVDEDANTSGMMIAGDSLFSFPSAEPFGLSTGTVSNLRSELQNLNDYLFFERPSYEEIKEAYAASNVSGQHPRVLATEDDFAEIKAAVQTNSYMSRWYQQLLVEADVLVEDNTESLKYELRDGVRLLAVAEEALNNMLVLGMAYQLTDDVKYAERAWIDLEAISNFKDWYAIPLDTGTFCAAVAIGYDWMYDAFTEDQLQQIEAAIYSNGYTLACREYMGNYGLMDKTVASYNQCTIINCGLAMAAMAFMDVYPEHSAYITANAIRGAEINLTEFGPDGAYREGAGYWTFTMTYVAKLLASLDSVFGTCFSLDLCEGLSTSADYMIYVQSDMGIFNYNDARETVYYVPEFFYLSDKYNNPSIASTILYMYDGKLQGDSNASDLVSSLLWYDTSVEADEEALPGLDCAYYGESLATMRDRWSAEVTTFVGVHGGYNQIVHGQLDAGTFVYDYAGIRWIKELGKTPYETSVTSNYATEGGRWRLFRSKAEAHNTIVIQNSSTSSTGTDQKVDAGASLTRFESKDKGAIAVVNMSEIYAGYGATSATRGVFFTDDRSSVVVRDEITLSEADSTVYSFFLTDTEVTIAEDGQSATLTHSSGKQVKMEFTATGTGTASLGVGPATRELLGSTSPITTAASDDENFYDAENADVNRIYVKMDDAAGEVAITVKLTPVGVKSTSIEEYNKSIEQWSIADGERAETPELIGASIDGRTLNFDSEKQAAFLSVTGQYNTVPELVVTLDETKYTYQVNHAESVDGGITTIIVSDKNDASVFSTYLVKFVVIPEPKEFDEMTSVQVVNVEASDEPQAASGYYRWCVLDNDTTSRWTSQGGGNWIQLELEKKTTIDNLLIAFYNPTSKERGSYFGINVSADGENWETVWSGTSDTTAQNGTYQQYELGGKTAKYVRLDCNGNTAQGITAGWNNIAEIVVTKNGTGASVTPTPTPEPTAEPTAAPTIAPTVAPTAEPTAKPATKPTVEPATEETEESTVVATAMPKVKPTATPTVKPTATPKVKPTTTPKASVTDIKIIPEKSGLSYEESDSSHDSSGKDTVTVYCTGEYDEFLRVEMDGKEVAKSNYTVREGSTILEFKTEYLKTLPAGEHVATLYYTNDRSVDVKITSIVNTDEKQEAAGDIKDSASTEGNEQTETSEKQEAEEDNNLLAWIVAILVIGGIAIILLVHRKKFKNILSIMLVCVLLSGMFMNVLSVEATSTDTSGTETSNTDTSMTLMITENIPVGENTLAFSVKVSYILPSEYDVLMEAYEEASTLKYSTGFNDCIEGDVVHDDKSIPDGEYYYCIKNDTYGGSVEYDGGNGYILMKDAYGQRIDVKPTASDMESVIVESKIQYNTQGIMLEFGLRGVKSSSNLSSRVATLGTLDNGTFTITGGSSIEITAEEWHTFTYVLNIGDKKYDLYIDGVQVASSVSYQYFRGFQGDDFFRIKATKLLDGVTGADIRIDDIKVYGMSSTSVAQVSLLDSDLTTVTGNDLATVTGNDLMDVSSYSLTTSSYEDLFTGYDEICSEDFNNCTDGTLVYDDKNMPDGVYYYCVNDGDGSYSGTVSFVRKNGYILMDEAYGQRIDVKPTAADKKYVIVESKIQYNTPGINLSFVVRGVKSNGKAATSTLGTLADGIFTTSSGSYSKAITKGEWHTFTYVLDIDAKTYNLYIDGEKLTTSSVSYQYFRGFQGDDQFRLYAANTSAPATSADIMIDDIKVYGSTTDPTAIQAITE